MEHLLAFIKKHLPIVIVCIFVGCSTPFFWHYWGDPAKAQTLGAFLGFVAAAILIGVTWEYVKINHNMLSLQQAQWEQQNRVVLRFGVRKFRGAARIWVANLGRTDFLISELLIRMKYDKKIVRKERKVVPSGSRQGIALPDELWTGKPLLLTFDVQLRYESQHESGISPAKGFTLYIADSSRVIKILSGIDDMWTVNCPKCGELAGAMITDELANFDEASERQHVMEQELVVSCPNHDSQWADSVEKIRERRAQNKNGDKVED